MITRIGSRADLESGLTVLVQKDARLANAIAALDEVPLRLRPPGFEGLADIITAQMVSRASANAIFARLKQAIAPFEALPFLEAGESVLIEAGLSRAKQATLTGLARAIVENRIDLEALCDHTVEDATAALVALKGIGPWTAEVYLMFCAGHADIFPAGDIALQHAMADILALPQRPDTQTARAIAEQWAPVRSCAARVLYAHYATMKGRTALP